MYGSRSLVVRVSFPPGSSLGVCGRSVSSVAPPLSGPVCSRLDPLCSWGHIWVPPLWIPCLSHCRRTGEWGRVSYWSPLSHHPTGLLSVCLTDLLSLRPPLSVTHSWLVGPPRDPTRPRLNMGSQKSCKRPLNIWELTTFNRDDPHKWGTPVGHLGFTTAEIFVTEEKRLDPNWVHPEKREDEFPVHDGGRGPSERLTRWVPHLYEQRALKTPQSKSSEDT